MSVGSEAGVLDMNDETVSDKSNSNRKLSTDDTHKESEGKNQFHDNNSNKYMLMVMMMMIVIYLFHMKIDYQYNLRWH